MNQLQLLQSKVDELKSKMPGEVYIELCKATKEVFKKRDGFDGPIYEVKYMQNIIMASTRTRVDDEAGTIMLSSKQTHVKYMRGGRTRCGMAHVGTIL